MESNVFSADEDLSVSVLQFFKEMMAKPQEFQDKVSHALFISLRWLYHTCTEKHE